MTNGEQAQVQPGLMLLVGVGLMVVGVVGVRLRDWLAVHLTLFNRRSLREESEWVSTARSAAAIFFIVVGALDALVAILRL
jgi:hypothetical protein